MARMRSVKPEFWTDRKMARLTRDARLLYISLWNQADEHGRLHGDARFIKGHCLPYDDDLSLAAIDGLLRELEGAGRVTRYDYEGDPFLYLPKLDRHQRLEPAKVPSRLPEPPKRGQAPSDTPSSASRADESARRSDESAPRANPSGPIVAKHVAGGMEHVAGGMEHVAGGMGQDSPPAAGDEDPVESEGQYVNRLAKTYTDRVPLTNFPAVAGVVRKAVRVGIYSEQQITAGLLALADEGRAVTTDALRYALDGMPTKATGRKAEQDALLRRWHEEALAGQMPELGA